MSAPASHLFHALSAELARLAVATEGFHDLLGGDRGDGFIRHAQSIDHTTQTLADLARFCATLADDTNADTSLTVAPALQTLRLSGLRDRLAARAPAIPAAADDSGLELF